MVNWNDAHWDALQKEYGQLLEAEHFIGIDIETTGLSPAKFAQIIELSAIRLDNDNPDKFTKIETLVRPTAKIPKKITNITGIKNEDVSSARGFNHIAKELYAFLGDSVIVAHNAMFEQRFLDYYLNYNQLFYTNTYFDTMKAMKLLFPETKGFNRLDKFLDMFGIVNDNWHNAGSDSLLTLVAFNELRKKYLEHYELDDKASYDFIDNDLSPEAWKVTSYRYWDKAYNTKNPKSRLYVRLKSPEGRVANIFYDYTIGEWDYNNSLTRVPLDFSEITKAITEKAFVDSLDDLNPHNHSVVF